MLADKFNRYKTVLSASVASIVIFHTLLLHIDARITPDELLFNRRESIEANLMCSRTGVTVEFENFTAFPEMFQQKLSVNWTVSDCQPIDCARHQPSWVRMCFSTGNCTNLFEQSTASFMLEGLDVPNEVPEASFKLVEVYAESKSGTILCNCLTACPVNISLPEQPLDEELLSAILQRKEAERIKHNRGFWLYFFVRILASGSVSVAFSM